MIAVFNDRMTNQFGSRTDLNTFATTYSPSTDVYWFVTSTGPAAADAVCVTYIGSTCDQERIRFNTNWAATQTLNQKRQGACHEIGHTVGFDDSQPEVNTGCMSGGGLGVLSAHEIGHINNLYFPY